MKLELEVKQVRGKLQLQVPKMGVELTLHEALTLLGFDANQKVVLITRDAYNTLMKTDKVATVVEIVEAFESVQPTSARDLTYDQLP